MTSQRIFALAGCLSFALACGSESNTPNGNTGGSTAAITAVELQFEVQEVPLGRTVRWLAIATLDDGTTKDVTEDAQWISSNDTVARLSTQTGEKGWLVSIAEGRTIVSATVEGQTTNNTFTVMAPEVTAIDVAPGGLTIGRGDDTRVLSVMAQRSDDSIADVTADVTWSSSDPNVARINDNVKASPTFTTFGTGAVTITAELNGLTQSVDFTVTDARVERITLSQDNPRLEVGSSIRIRATGTYTDQNSADVSSQVTWTSDDPNLVTISPEGLITAVASGDANVTATLGNVTATTRIRAFNPGECNYPENLPSMITYDAPMPSMFWEDALMPDGTAIDFRLSQFHCSEQYSQYETIAFVVGAGWCPYCPDYKRAVNAQRDELEAAGMLVVYIEIETSSSQPASNAQANNIVRRTLGDEGGGIRIGDGDTKPNASQFARVVRALPSAIVVRKSDMKVIADQNRGNTRLNLPAIAANPDRLY